MRLQGDTEQTHLFLHDVPSRESVSYSLHFCRLNTEEICLRLEKFNHDSSVNCISTLLFFFSCVLNCRMGFRVFNMHQVRSLAVVKICSALPRRGFMQVSQGFLLPHFCMHTDHCSTYEVCSPQCQHSYARLPCPVVN